MTRAYRNVAYCGKVVGVSRNREFGFIGFDTITRLDGIGNLGLPKTGDLRIHINENPLLGETVPANALLEFLVTEDLHPKSRSGLKVIDAKRVGTANTDVDGPRYRGQLTHVSSNGSYGFIRISSVTNEEGGTVSLPVDTDLMLHISRNRALGDPLPKGAMVTFSLTRDYSPKSATGYEAVNAVRA